MSAHGTARRPASPCGWVRDAALRHPRHVRPVPSLALPSVGGFATVLGRRLMGNGPLRRVLLAYLLFSAAEYGTWVAMLLYAYERTGPLSVGLVALIQLVPAALLAPAASALGDRYRREVVLAGGYAVQAVAMFATGLSMLADAPPPLTYALAAVRRCAVLGRHCERRHECRLGRPRDDQ